MVTQSMATEEWEKQKQAREEHEEKRLMRRRAKRLKRKQRQNSGANGSESESVNSDKPVPKAQTPAIIEQTPLQQPEAQQQEEEEGTEKNEVGGPVCEVSDEWSWVRVRVHVTAGSHMSKITTTNPESAEMLSIDVAAPQDRHNLVTKELTSFLEHTFKLEPDAVTVITGHKAPDKVLQFRGIKSSKFFRILTGG
eukprot:c18094_g1_i5.p1 GENE.c18094_g1_i5~~c18094_g1_i5.p1  ORF type:complete len:195 (-),score=51.83 c18094_g1_i5:60-644(-)